MGVVASEGDADVTREFDLPGTRINDQRVEMDRLDATAKAGATEIWELAISDGISHNFHVHGVQFQVVGVDGVDGEPPSPLYCPAGRTPYSSDPTRPYGSRCCSAITPIRTCRTCSTATWSNTKTGA
jgi:FtsP/CotA-like multicopper oxidase with cupredoxin domain